VGLKERLVSESAELEAKLDRAQRLVGGTPQTQNPSPTQNPKPETQNHKPETQNPNPEPET